MLKMYQTPDLHYNTSAARHVHPWRCIVRLCSHESKPPLPNTCTSKGALSLMYQVWTEGVAELGQEWPGASRSWGCAGALPRAGMPVVWAAQVSEGACGQEQPLGTFAARVSTNSGLHTSGMLLKALERPAWHYECIPGTCYCFGVRSVFTDLTWKQPLSFGGLAAALPWFLNSGKAQTNCEVL